MKAVALTCARCGGRLLAAPGVPLGVCNPCSTAFDLTTGEKRPIPVEEAVPPGDDEILERGAPEEGRVRLPFLRFDASGAGAPARVFVMAFALRKLGTPHDDGSRLTAEEVDPRVRPGGVDVAPEISVPSAAGLARYIALRRLDPDGRFRLRPTAVRLGDPTLLSIPFVEKQGRLVDPFTGQAFEREVVEGAPAPERA